MQTEVIWPRQSNWFTGETNWTWSGNVVFCWGYHCSSLCIGCILPWLLMLCRSTLLSSEWWTNRQWFSPRKSTVFYCFHVSCVCLLAARLLPVRHMQFIEYIFYYRLLEEASFIRQKKKTHHYYEVWQNILPLEWKRIGLGYFSMVQLVALSWRTDPIVLLCNRKDLIYIWVFKPLDCSSPKSMWFLWNIFSKGTHMLQCLCGKSLKKNKNPSGKLITIMPAPLVSLWTGVVPVVCENVCVWIIRFVCCKWW